MKRRLLPCLLLALALSGSAFASTLHVTSLQDNGPGSLRQVIADANPGDTIAFSVTGTITLGSQLFISKSLTIQGPGAGLLTISGNNTGHVFLIQGGPVISVTLDSLTIAHGTSGPSFAGGAIWNTTSLTVSHSIVSGNSATLIGGGGIFSTGPLTVSHSTFSGNSGHLGGAIYSSGPLKVSDSTFSGNTADSGAAIRSTHSTLTVSHSTISGNSTSASGEGGGIDIDNGTLTVSNSILSANSANVGGAVFVSYSTGTLSSSTVSGNSASGPGSGGGSGGGIYFIYGTLGVSNSKFSGNSAGLYGGGIAISSVTVSVSNSVLSANSAVSGGAVYALDSTGTLSSSTVSGNSASGSGSGGGIFFHNPNGTLGLSNSTFSGNSASHNGGGIYCNFGTLGVSNSTFSGNGADSGGGVYVFRGTARVSNSTFSSNSARTGGAILNAATLIMSNTILANSPSGHNLDNFGTFNDQGYNLDSHRSSPLTASTDRIGVDPRLGPLQNNGGPTQTHALLAGSPAIDTGSNAIAPATDQRGLARVADANGDGIAVIDIGAYELQPAADLSIRISATPSSVTDGASLRYTISVENLGPTAAAGVVVTDALPSKTVFLGASATSGKLSTPPVGSSGTLTAQLGTLASGAKGTVTLTVKVELKKGTITNSATVSSGVSDPVMSNNIATVVTSVK